MSEFLTSRRAKITPEQAGLPWFGGNRRVPGLRREEVALLAGVSVDYYTRLERGTATGVSETVLEALARALQLDEAERAHLFDLARASSPTPRRRRRAAPQRVRPSVQRMLDAIDRRAGVRAKRAHGPPRSQPPSAAPSTPSTSTARTGLPNSARFIFLDPRAHATSTSTGSRSRPTPSRSSAPKPDATPTTVASRTSSASCRRGARRSAPDGPRTTSASTTPAPSASTTRSSATSSSPTRP